MLARALRRIERAGWTNVHLVEADAERFELPEFVHGLLCFFVHDILISPAAIPRALGFVMPGGRVVAAGVKLAGGWRGWVINPITVAYSLTGVTNRDIDRAHRPFAELEKCLIDFRVEERLLGSHYLVSGRWDR